MPPPLLLARLQARSTVLPQFARASLRRQEPLALLAEGAEPEAVERRALRDLTRLRAGGAGAPSRGRELADFRFLVAVDEGRAFEAAAKAGGAAGEGLRFGACDAIPVEGSVVLAFPEPPIGQQGVHVAVMEVRSGRVEKLLSAPRVEDSYDNIALHEWEPFPGQGGRPDGDSLREAALQVHSPVGEGDAQVLTIRCLVCTEDGDVNDGSNRDMLQALAGMFV
ncbi:hypothetical protein TeGR_g10063 [Tetraparma gracilis]|uniref:Uncharacterized protein n=1 Tax=Tetraparma gracilis TaxID=2962635 RepID=A0ABQ6M5M5_9STRA|nr:hypothetical protein TeGR_g10063 [Tetraparma gracilis]